MASGSRRSSLRLSLPRPMPMIVEDDAAPPRPPPRSPRRPVSGSGPTSHARYTPSLQSRANSVPDRAPDPAQRQHMRERSAIAKRGGWYRLALVAAVLIAIIVGLSVGLTIGLRSRNDQSQAGPPLPTAYFPSGSYTFTTALTNVSTACTSNPATFRCFPYATYSQQSPNTSAAIFSWVIAPVSSSSYVISSSDNPFAPSFTNLSLTLLDPNQYSERFVFNFTMERAVVPAASLAGSPATATCWFNQTVMTATLWTRDRATYPGNISSVPAPRNATFNFDPWPYQVDVRETQAAGPNVPDCLGPSGNPVGDFHVTPAPGAASDCACIYTNYGLPTGNVTVNRKRRYVR